MVEFLYTGLRFIHRPITKVTSLVEPLKPQHMAAGLVLTLFTSTQLKPYTAAAVSLLPRPQALGRKTKTTYGCLARNRLKSRFLDARP